MKPYRYPKKYVPTQRFLHRHVISRTSGEITRILYEIIIVSCSFIISLPSCNRFQFFIILGKDKKLLKVPNLFITFA